MTSKVQKDFGPIVDELRLGLKQTLHGSGISVFLIHGIKIWLIYVENTPLYFFFLMNDSDSQLYFEEMFLRRNKTLISMLQCISRLIHM